MARTIKLTEDLSIAPHPPDAEDLRDLQAQGFRSVVNLRTEAERDAPLDPREEGDRAREAGLEYLHFPTAPDALSPSHARAFRERLETLPAPVAVHCASGKRASIMALAVLAQDAFAAARSALGDAGIDVPGEKVSALRENPDR